MTTGNFSDPPAPVTPSDPQPRGFRLPADYYASPASEIRPMFAKWVPFGCGIAAIVFLIVLTAGGAWISRNGIGPLMDLALAPTATVIPSIYAEDVTPAARQRLQTELTLFREHVRENRISPQQMQPILTAVQEMVGDKRLTVDEVRTLTAELSKANQAAK